MPFISSSELCSRIKALFSKTLYLNNPFLNKIPVYLKAGPTLLPNKHQAEILWLYVQVALHRTEVDRIKCFENKNQATDMPAGHVFTSYTLPMANLMHVCPKIKNMCSQVFEIGGASTHLAS